MMKCSVAVMWRREKFQAEARSQSDCKYSLVFILCLSLLQTSHGEDELDAHINSRGCGVSEPTGRVYNGDTIEKPQIPWIVQIVGVLGGGKANLCGGSIISHNVILTAAHCVETEPPAQQFLIFYNTTRPNQGPVTIVERFTKHHRFNKQYAAKYDVALLKVGDRISFDRFVRPICLPKRRIPLNGRWLMAGGWGAKNDRKPPEFPETLLYTTFRAMSREKCHSLLSRVESNDGSGGFDAKFNLCSSTITGNLCGGDSGAPVTMRQSYGRSVQVGVHSLGTSCSEHGKYTIAVRVAEFLPWIKKSLRNPESWETAPSP